MSTDHAHEVREHGAHEIDVDHHVRSYILVFVALLALTLVTVAVSYLDLPTGPAIALALVVAAVKGALVAGYFMHLVSERKLIYWVLAVTVVFFLFVLLVPVLTELDEVVL
jgi:cytochrome c oxidase subunit 4